MLFYFYWNEIKVKSSSLLNGKRRLFFWIECQVANSKPQNSHHHIQQGPRQRCRDAVPMISFSCYLLHHVTSLFSRVLAYNKSMQFPGGILFLLLSKGKWARIWVILSKMHLYGKLFHFKPYSVESIVKVSNKIT